MRYLSILTLLFVTTLIHATADAGILIEVDLSVSNKLTLRATTEVASKTKSGSTGTGIILESLTSAAIGNLYSNEDPATFGFKESGTLASRVKLANVSGTNHINLFEETFSQAVASTITAGAQAFVGTATFDLTIEKYNAFLNAPNSGKIYAYADTESLMVDTFHIGDWARAGSSTVPEPSTAIAMGLLGIVGFAGNRRRRVRVANA